MENNLTIRKPADQADVDRFYDVLVQSLNFPFPPDPSYNLAEREGMENIRLIWRGDEIAGGLSIIPMGQWFGGRSVPMGGIRIVAVAAHHRSSGVATHLLRKTLEELHARGVPLSTLYPATQPLYRRVGYEQAGVYLGYGVPTHMIDARDRALEIRPARESDQATIQELYRRRARQTSGNLDRGPWVWRRIFQPWKEKAYIYLIMRGGQAEGYVSYVIREQDGPPLRDLIYVLDSTTLTADAGRRLWTLFADHRSTCQQVRWRGAPADPRLYLLAEQKFEIFDRFDWMLRIVDVRGALEARGYPPSLRTEVHFEIWDDVLPHNNGRFTLEVAEGRGRVRAGGDGSVHLDIRGLAPLYTGHLSPAALQMTGHAKGSEHALAAAEAAFAGPETWMGDMF